MVNPPKTIPTRSGVNFAPLTPLIDLAQKGQGKPPTNSLNEDLKSIFSYRATHEQVTWRDIYSAAQLVDLMIQGRPPSKRNINTGLWIPQSLPNDPMQKRWINTMRFYEKMLLARWQSSNPDIIIKATGEDDRDRMAAKNANPVLDEYEHRFFTNDFSEREGGMALRSGMYVHHIYYDGSKQAIKGLRRIMQNQELTFGTGDGYCGECDYQGEAEDFREISQGPLKADVCPRCGSTATEVERPQQTQLPSRAGTEEVYTGDISLGLWPLQSMRWDLTGPPEESTWLIHRQRSSLSRVRALLGPILIKTGDVSDIGLESLEKLAYTGVPISGQSSGGQRRPSVYKDPVNVEEMYLDVEEVADIKLNKPERTVDGEELPAGVPLSELFPNGLVVCGLNSMNVITGIYAESHRQQIVTGYWHRNPHSGIGDGVGDAVEVEKRANTIDSQFINGMQAYSTPGFLHVKGVLEENERRYLGTPTVNFAIDTSTLPQDMRGDLGKLVKPAYEPRSVPVQMMQYVQEFLRGAMQLTMGVTEFSDALPGMAGRNETATGAQIEQEVSRMMSTPTLQGKASVRVRDAEILIGLFQEHMVLKQAFSVRGKGRQSFKWLAAADVKGKLRFEAVPNSEIARHLYEKIRDYDGFYAVFGGYTGYLQARQMFPKEVMEEARRRNVKLEESDYDELTELCLNRLDQMREGIGRAQVPEELLLLINPPISQVESLLNVQTKWWQDYLITPQGQEEAQVVRLAIELIIKNQYWDATAQDAMAGLRQGITQAATAAPEALGSQLLQSGDDSGQAGQQMASEEAARGQEREIKEGDRQEAYFQRTHEASEADKNRKHEQKMKGLDMQMKAKELAAQKAKLAEVAA